MTQNFASLANNAPATLPSGWKVDAATKTTVYSSAGTATQLFAGTDNPGVLSGSSAGGTYNFANGKANNSTTDRAVGWLSSSTYATDRNLFVQLRNNTGGIITDLTVAFNIEKYRNGTTSNAITFFGSTNGSTWTSIPAGDQSYPAGSTTTVINPPTSVAKSATINGLNIPNGSDYYLRWNYNGSASANAQALGIDDFSVTASGPNVTVSPASLGFGTVRVGAASGEQSYTVSGNKLTSDVTVNAPAGFEITTTSGSNYASSLVLSPSSGTLSATTVFARFVPTANGAAAGNISHASPGAATRNVALSGTGDNVPPSIGISAPSLPITNAGPVTYTVTYTDAAAITLQNSDISLNSTGSAAGTISVSGTGSASRTVTISGISGDGTLGISVGAGTASDAVGNVAGAAGPSGTFTVDNTAPVATIGTPSMTETRTGPVSFPVTYTGAGAVTLSPADVSLIATGNATGTVAVTGTGTASRTVTISGISGDGTLAIALADATATDGAGNQAAAAGPSDAVTVDSMVPVISVDAPALTAFGPVRAGDTSPEQSYVVGGTGLRGDLSITAPAGFEVSTTSGSDFASSLTLPASERVVTSTTVYVRFLPTADGTVSGALLHSSLEADGVSLPVSGTADGIPPAISISAPSATAVNGGSVDYTVTYSGASVVTLQETDVILHATGTSTGTVTVSGSGTDSRTVTVSGISGDGTLSISVAAGTASDEVGNVALAAGPSASFTVDTTPPAVTISAPLPASSLAGPVTFTVGYTGATSVTLSEADISLIATGTTTGTLALSGDGVLQRTVTISGISGNGTLAIAVAPGTASDALGNLALAAGPSTAAVIDTAGPNVSFSPPSVFYVRTGNVNYKILYEDAASIMLTAADIIINTTGTATAVAVVEVGNSPHQRNVRIQSVSGDGEISISVRAGTAVDSLGNLAPAAGPSLSFIVDNTSPHLVSAVAATTQSIDVTFSEAMRSDALTTSAYTVTGPGAGTFAAQPDSVTALTTDTYRLTWSGQQEMRQGEPFVLAAANVSDLAGNLLTLPNSAIGMGIGEAPVVLTLVPQSGQSVDITFTEAVGPGALDPLQYTVSGPGQGTVSPNPDQATLVSGNTYRLSWNSGSMVNGAPLTVVVGGVSDLAGNPIDPSNSETISALPVTCSAFSIE